MPTAAPPANPAGAVSQRPPPTARGPAGWSAAEVTSLTVDTTELTVAELRGGGGHVRHLRLRCIMTRRCVVRSVLREWSRSTAGGLERATGDPGVARAGPAPRQAGRAAQPLQGRDARGAGQVRRPGADERPVRGRGHRPAHPASAGRRPRVHRGADHPGLDEHRTADTILGRPRSHAGHHGSNPSRDMVGPPPWVSAAGGAGLSIRPSTTLCRRNRGRRHGALLPHTSATRACGDE